jgi:hypothetical protein
MMGGGIFNYYGPENYKFIAIKADTHELVIGHRTPEDWVIDDTVTNSNILAGTVYYFSITAHGNQLSVILKDAYQQQIAALSHTYDTLVADGQAGIFTRFGWTSFARTTVSIDEPTVIASNQGLALMAAAAPSASEAGGGSTLTTASLEPIVQEAIRRWDEALNLNQTQLALLNEINFQIADLSGLTLARTEADTIIVDTDAAGYGWFIDSTPSTDTEFGRHQGKGELLAGTSSKAFGDMDLLTVVMHEFGHVLGYNDISSGVQSVGIMDSTVDAGERLLPDQVKKTKRITKPAKAHQAFVFDEKSGELTNTTKKSRRPKIDRAAVQFQPAWAGTGVLEEEKDGWIIEV